MPSAVLWDWNGTLLDDVDISLEAVNLLLSEYNMNGIDKEQYYSYIDTPIIKFYSHLFDLDKIPFSHIGGIFHRNYKRLLHKSGLMDGAFEAIVNLHRMGVRQYIVSASHRDGIVKGAKDLGIFDYMTDIIAADDYTASSKVERTADYFKRLGIDTSNCLVIGDTLHDYSMAMELGSVCVLTALGHEGRKKLSATHSLLIDEIDLEKIIRYFRSERKDVCQS